MQMLMRDPYGSSSNVRIASPRMPKDEKAALYGLGFSRCRLAGACIIFVRLVPVHTCHVACCPNPTSSDTGIAPPILVASYTAILCLQRGYTFVYGQNDCLIPSWL